MTYQEIFGSAAFVTPSVSCMVPCIRGEFMLDGEIASASVTACGLGLCELSLNGMRISDAKNITPYIIARSPPFNRSFAL
jgi:hypothetical protein